MVKFIPYNKNLTNKARENRKNSTCAESKLWCELLKDKHFYGYKFQRQKPLLEYIVDFYCKDLSLVIELDGDSHSEQAVYDDIRTKNLNFYGIKVVRYFNNDVMCNLEGVYEDLARVVKQLEKPTPTLPYQGGSMRVKTHPNPPLSGREHESKNPSQPSLIREGA